VTDDRYAILSVEVQTMDGVAVVSVGGEVDLVSGRRLAEEIRRALDGDRVSSVVVDLGGTRFLDSSGIAVLLTGRREANAKGVGYRVEAAHGIVREVLVMTGVWDELSQGEGA
jgi:anti-sigma B factor antagonist